MQRGLINIIKLLCGQNAPKKNRKMGRNSSMAKGLTFCSQLQLANLAASENWNAIIFHFAQIFSNPNLCPSYGDVLTSVELQVA